MSQLPHLVLGLLGISMLIPVEKKAKGGGGSAPVSPVNTVAPVVSGTTVVGNVLSTTDGTWTGTATINFTYQWKQDAGTTIVAATANTYTTVGGDVGHTIFCTVTGTNGAGATAANSNSVGPITASAGSFVPTFEILGF